MGPVDAIRFKAIGGSTSEVTNLKGAAELDLDIRVAGVGGNGEPGRLEMTPDVTAAALSGLAIGEISTLQ